MCCSDRGEEEDGIDEGQREMDEGREKRRAKWDIIHYGVMTVENEKMTSFACRATVCLDLADTYSMGRRRLET